MVQSALPVFLFVACVVGLALALLVIANIFNPVRPGNVKKMPYESGMDPIHDTRRRFDVRFNLLAIAFLVFDVELLFLYPWAVAMRPAALDASETSAASTVSAADASETASLETTASADGLSTALSANIAKPRGIDAAVAVGDVQSRNVVFASAMVFLVLLTLGYVYDWKKGVFQWR